MSPRALLAGTSCVLLDFDGPVCSVFAGLSAPEVAETLASTIRTQVGDGRAMPQGIEDPLVVFRVAAERWPDQAVGIQALLTEAEIIAVKSAAPTPGVAEFLAECHRTGRQVVIVSNNGTQAVRSYLDSRSLLHLVAHIEARVSADPTLMKPNPHLVRRAVMAAQSTPEECVLIGDSVTDVEAAHAAGVRAIGYANKPGKSGSLTDAGADAVCTDMHELAEAIS